MECLEPEDKNHLNSFVYKIIYNACEKKYFFANQKLIKYLNSNPNLSLSDDYKLNNYSKGYDNPNLSINKTLLDSAKLSKMALSGDPDIKKAIISLYGELLVLYDLNMLDPETMSEIDLLFENITNKGSIYDKEFYWFTKIWHDVKDCQKEIKEKMSVHKEFYVDLIKKSYDQKIIDCVINNDDEIISIIKNTLTSLPNHMTISYFLILLSRIYQLPSDSSRLDRIFKPQLEIIKNYFSDQFNYNLNFDVDQKIDPKTLSNLKSELLDINKIYNLISIYKRSIIGEKSMLKEILGSNKVINKLMEPFKRKDTDIDEYKTNSKFNYQEYCYELLDLNENPYSKNSLKEYSKNEDNLKFIKMLLKGSNYKGELQDFYKFVIELINLDVYSISEKSIYSYRADRCKELLYLFIDSHFEKLGAIYWFNTKFLINIGDKGFSNNTSSSSKVNAITHIINILKTLEAKSRKHEFLMVTFYLLQRYEDFINSSDLKYVSNTLDGFICLDSNDYRQRLFYDYKNISFEYYNRNYEYNHKKTINILNERHLEYNTNRFGKQTDPKFESYLNSNDFLSSTKDLKSDVDELIAKSLETED